MSVSLRKKKAGDNSTSQTHLARTVQSSQLRTSQVGTVALLHLAATKGTFRLVSSSLITAADKQRFPFKVLPMH